MFLAYVSPLGRALVDKGLDLPKSQTGDPERCSAAGVPKERRRRRSKPVLSVSKRRTWPCSCWGRRWGEGI